MHMAYLESVVEQIYHMFKEHCKLLKFWRFFYTHFFRRKNDCIIDITINWRLLPTLLGGNRKNKLKKWTIFPHVILCVMDKNF